jgi:hypothetical protein
VVSVLVPLTRVVCGPVAAGLVRAVETAITGMVRGESLHIVGYAGGQLLLCTLIGLLIQEALVSGRQRRPRAAAAGWITLVAGTLLLAAVSFDAQASQGPWTWPILHGAGLVAALGAMVVIVLLYTGRNDFTR